MSRREEIGKEVGKDGMAVWQIKHSRCRNRRVTWAFGGVLPLAVAF